MQDPLLSVAAAIQAVGEELRAHNAGIGRVSNARQLTKFRETLESMKRQIESDTVPTRAARRLILAPVALIFLAPCITGMTLAIFLSALRKNFPGESVAREAMHRYETSTTRKRGRVKRR